MGGEICKNTNVLEVSELSVSFLVDEEYIKCVRNVSFTVKAGECLAIVGESGCGKSVTAKSVMGLIRQQNGKISKNSRILFENEDMLNNDKKQWTQVRGKDIAMVFQDSMSALNPTMRIGKQIEEILLNHKICKKSDAKKKTIQLLKKVGIPYAENAVVNIHMIFGWNASTNYDCYGDCMQPPIVDCR